MAVILKMLNLFAASLYYGTIPSFIQTQIIIAFLSDCRSVFLISPLRCWLNGTPVFGQRAYGSQSRTIILYTKLLRSMICRFFKFRGKYCLCWLNESNLTQFWLFSPPIILTIASTKLSEVGGEGVGGILISRCPFVRLSVCGSNRVRTVPSTILAGPSGNFPWMSGYILGTDGSFDMKTKEKWIGVMSDPLYDLDIWPHPRPWQCIFKVNFWK